ncbi:MAG: Maf family protein [Chloroflexota bacterium]|nr:Maf family protein [Chloroflexota bacterium]
MKNLILASNSPRRKELLSLFGWPFTIVPADIAEDRLFDEKPKDYVRRLATEKAVMVAKVHHGLVIGADTIVVDVKELMGKPVDQNDARRMLRQLRSRTHHVYTGIALLDSEPGKVYCDVCCTDVPMRAYSDAEIESYIKTGDPMDKAGAYAIQHDDFHPVEDLQGCFASVMGLPLCHLAVGLSKFGMDIPAELPDRCQALLNYACPIQERIMGLVERD